MTKTGKSLLMKAVDTAVGALDEKSFAMLEAVPPEVEWFANIRNPNTKRAYKRDVSEFMAFLGIADVGDLRRVGRAHVIAWRSRIEVRNTQTKKCVNAGTVRRKLAAVSSLFEYMCDRNAVLGNPVNGVARPNEGANTGKTPAISDRQARELLAAPSLETLVGKRDRAILALFLYHGPRVAEVASLSVGDLIEIKELPHWRIHGKGGKVRDVPAHPLAVAAVREYLKAAGHAKDVDGPLFRPVPNYWGRRTAKVCSGISARSIYDVVCLYAEKVGIKAGAARPHAMRATAATNALEHGADIVKVRDWLGHANIATTTLYDKRGQSPENSPTFKVSY